MLLRGLDENLAGIWQQVPYTVLLGEKSSSLSFGHHRNVSEVSGIAVETEYG